MVGSGYRTWVLVGVVLATLSSSDVAKAQVKPTICLQPLGAYEAHLLEAARRGIGYLYGMEVRVLAGKRLPTAAYYRPRRRYRADKLLHHLDAKVVPSSGCRAVIGFTSSDISTTKGKYKDWGIFGLAWIGGRSAVVSTHRLKRRASSRLQQQRVVKVVNHELGHALGIGHVPGKGCLMADAAGTVKTVDRESGLLCESTRRRISKREGLILPKYQRFDWIAVLD